MGRYSRRTSWPPLAALAVLLLLIIISVSLLFRCGAAARPLPVHHETENDGGKDAAYGLVVLHQEGTAGNGDALSASSEMIMEEEVELACGEVENDDECAQRRLLGDAHLDYIYTQHKGKP